MEQLRAKALIVKSGKFLVLSQEYEGKTYWYLPGGKLKEDESSQQCIVREVQEETNLQVKALRRLGSYISLRSEKEVPCLLYLCEPLTMQVDLSKNPDKYGFSGYAWVTKEEFLADLYPVSHPRLKQLLSSVTF